ncbi:MAG: hypothetical protein JNL50_09940 [Phycisphaerae bacterium]|nr:hypothetical protein [Phycisphaerae bacterium]
MQRPGINPEHAEMSDFLCDFCRQEWTAAIPMVEGHRGSLICASCLTIAYTDVFLLNLDAAPAPATATSTCTLCLQDISTPSWKSPDHACFICKKCINHAASVLAKDPDFNWKKPSPAK